MRAAAVVRRHGTKAEAQEQPAGALLGWREVAVNGAW
jgi:hypothetical protein